LCIFRPPARENDRRSPSRDDAGRAPDSDVFYTVSTVRPGTLQAFCRSACEPRRSKVDIFGQPESDGEQTFTAMKHAADIAQDAELAAVGESIIPMLGN
jgi:hypothetical protein